MLRKAWSRVRAAVSWGDDEYRRVLELQQRTRDEIAKVEKMQEEVRLTAGVLPGVLERVQRQVSDLHVENEGEARQLLEKLKASEATAETLASLRKALEDEMAKDKSSKAQS